MPKAQFVPPVPQPELERLDAAVGSVHWCALRRFLEETYTVEPLVEYSRCTAAPGWNVKYRKGGRALCTLYPGEGGFTCMVALGPREAAGVELLLPQLSPELQALYHAAGGVNGSRWLMIEVEDAQRLEEVKRLIALRVSPPVRR